MKAIYNCGDIEIIDDERQGISSDIAASLKNYGFTWNPKSERFCVKKTESVLSKISAEQRENVLSMLGIEIVDIDVWLWECFEKSCEEELAYAQKLCVCVLCGADAISFKRKMARQEYQKSGLCEKCQKQMQNSKRGAVSFLVNIAKNLKEYLSPF